MTGLLENYEIDGKLLLTGSEKKAINKARDCLYTHISENDDDKLFGEILEIDDEGAQVNKVCFLKCILGGESFWLYNNAPPVVSPSATDVSKVWPSIDEIRKENGLVDGDKRKEILTSLENFSKFFNINFLDISEVYTSTNGLILYHCKKKQGKLYNLPTFINKALSNVLSAVLDCPKGVFYAIENFSSLAVKTILPALTKSNYAYVFRALSRPPYMIFPFSKDDIKDIKDIEKNITSDCFWERIRDRNDFKNLVKYVKENNYNPKITETDIIGAYHELIRQVIEYTKR